MDSSLALWASFAECAALHGVRRDGRDRGGVDLAGPDADHALERLHKDFPVADLTGARGREDRLDGRLDERFGARHLEPHLFTEFEHHGAAAIVLLQLVLSTVSADAADRDPGDPGTEQRGLDLGQPVGANDGGDEFHGQMAPSSGSRSPAANECGAVSLRMTADATSGVSG